MSSDQTMKAASQPDYGAPIEIAKMPVPAPAEGEVRVRVETASVNGFDLSVAAGKVKGMMEHRFPLVLGKDFAGTIDSVGPGVTGFQPGDRVFGVVTKPYLGDGSFGEFVTVPTSIGVAHLPAGIDFQTAGALGLAGTTARLAVDAAEIKGGQRVLIVGATGGVGAIAVQLAKQAGAVVIATAHGDEAVRLVTGLGADEVVDYMQDVAEQVRAEHTEGVDVVLHFAADPMAVLPLVRSGGKFVSTMIMSPDQISTDTVTVKAIYAMPTAEVLNGLASAVAGGQLSVPIQATYSLDDVSTAFGDFAKGALGKLAVRVRT